MNVQIVINDVFHTFLLSLVPVAASHPYTYVFFVQYFTPVYSACHHEIKVTYMIIVCFKDKNAKIAAICLTGGSDFGSNGD